MALKPHQKLAVTAKEAASLLSLKVDQFLELVQEGCMIPPTRFKGGIEVWSVSALQAVLDGSKIEEDDFET